MIRSNYRNLRRSPGRGYFCLGIAICLLPGGVLAGLSPSYYDGVNTSSPSLLRSSLNATISAGHTSIGYDGTWAPLRDIDEAPAAVDQVRLIYGGALRDKLAGTGSDGSPVTGGWNREHMFPQSFFNQYEPMRSDIHALFPSDTDVNTRRSNFPYDVVTSPTYQDVLGNKATSTVFEPADVDKGRAARAVLYMDIRYEGLNGEPNLTVTNTYPGGTGAGQMAFLNSLLNWHRQYPPDAIERARNYKAYRYQQNPNPFVDHPEWVDDLYGGPVWSPQDGNTLALAGNGPPGSTITAGSAEIPVLTVPTTTTGQEVHLLGITLHQAGTIADSEITSVNVWYDVDADSMVSPEDSRLASGTFSGNVTSIELKQPFFSAAGFNQLLVTVNVPVWATAGKTIKLNLQDGGVRLSSTGGIDSVLPFGEISGNEHVVANNPDAFVGLVLSEVFEGSQGNLKYVELYNNTSNTLVLGSPDLVLRRYTNGNSSPTILPLPAATIPSGELLIIANNSSDFTAAFGFAPDAADSNITHNGNDCYELIRTSGTVVLDSFAGDRIGSAADFSVDRVAHRLPDLLPNGGNWGAPVSPNPADGSVSPSGFWMIRSVTPGNANAQQVGTPGQLTDPMTSVDSWSTYDSNCPGTY